MTDAFSGVLGGARGRATSAGLDLSEVMAAFLDARSASGQALTCTVQNSAALAGSGSFTVAVLKADGILAGLHVRQGALTRHLYVCAKAVGDDLADLARSVPGAHIEAGRRLGKRSLAACVADAPARRALAAAGAADADELLTLVSEGLTDRLRAYLAAAVANPGAGTYELGEPIDGRRLDKTEEAIAGLWSRGLVCLGDAGDRGMAVTPTDDGMAVAAEFES